MERSGNERRWEKEWSLFPWEKNPTDFFYSCRLALGYRRYRCAPLCYFTITDINFEGWLWNISSNFLCSKWRFCRKISTQEVDNRIIFSINTKIRLLVTASDVTHSWTIPSLGVKADAIAWRLNQVSFSINRARVFYGQCSEICVVCLETCGANHHLCLLFWSLLI